MKKPPLLPIFLLSTCSISLFAAPTLALACGALPWSGPTQIFPLSGDDVRPDMRFWINSYSSPGSHEHYTLVSEQGEQVDFQLTRHSFSWSTLSPLQSLESNTRYTLTYEAPDDGSEAPDFERVVHVRGGVEDALDLSLQWRRVRYTSTTPEGPCGFNPGFDERHDLDIRLEYWGAPDVFVEIERLDKDQRTLSTTIAPFDGYLRDHSPTFLEPPPSVSLSLTNMGHDTVCLRATAHHSDGTRGEPKITCLPDACEDEADPDDTGLRPISRDASCALKAPIEATETPATPITDNAPSPTIDEQSQWDREGDLDDGGCSIAMPWPNTSRTPWSELILLLGAFMIMTRRRSAPPIQENH